MLDMVSPSNGLRDKVKETTGRTGRPGGSVSSSWRNWRRLYVTEATALFNANLQNGILTLWGGTGLVIPAQFIYRYDNITTRVRERQHAHLSWF
jgi:hypothetical protein